MDRELGNVMLRYEPIRGSHAVQEAVFFVQFAPEIDADAFSSISAQSSEISEILPIKSDIRRIQLTAKDDGASSFSEGVAGVEFRRMAPEGTPAWVLRFSAEMLSVHCTDYTRYDEVWGQARTLLLRALELVPAGHAIGALGLRYIDRFKYNSDAGKYDLTHLFSENSKYVAQRSFEAGTRWHCHHGWFAPVHGVDPNIGIEAECLNQLNMGSAEEIAPAGSSIIVTIDHNLTVRPGKLGQFSASEDNHDWLDQLMLALHKDNKRTMTHLLTDTVCQRLNLMSDERG